MFNTSRMSLLLTLLLISVNTANAQPLLQVAKLGKSDSTTLYSPKITSDNEATWSEMTDEFVSSYSKGDLNKAGSIAQNSLSFSKRIFGKQHQNTADALNKMGIVYEANGDLEAAKSYYEDSLSMFETSLGKKNAKVAMVLNNLANLFFLKENFSKAEELHLRSLLMRQNLFSSVHPTVARSAYNLGKLYEKQAKLDDAVIFYKQASVLWKKTLGPNHLNVANTFNNLANVYAARGNNTASEELHLKALTIRESNLGPEHMEVAESLFNLGTICTKQEKYDEAESFYQEALGIMEHALEENDPQIAMTLYSLANIYHIQAQNEVIYNQGLSDIIDENQKIKVSDTTTSNKNNIIIVQLKFRKQYVGEIFGKAEPLYKRAINIVETNYGAEHPSVKVMKEELTMLYANIENSMEQESIATAE